MAVIVAEDRYLRALALSNGLDPETTAPEDLLLLRRNKDGDLAAADELSAAYKRAEFQRRLESE